MTPDEIETLEELKRHYALRMGSGRRYYDALRAALRDAAALSRPAPSDALALRHAWEAGFRLCRSYGDNHHHFDGEQKERKWRDYIEGLAAPAQVAAPAVSDDRVAALLDSQYRAGAKAGWNAAHGDNPEEAIARLIGYEAGSLAPVATPAPDDVCPRCKQRTSVTCGHWWHRACQGCACECHKGAIAAEACICYTSAAPAPETPAPDAAPLPCPECREVDRVWAVGDGRYRCAACDVGYTLSDVKTPAPAEMPAIRVGDWVCEWASSVHRVEHEEVVGYWTKRSNRINEMRGERNGQPFIWRRQEAQP